jgi:GNAT superfamily N-acetyltransferase
VGEPPSQPPPRGTTRAFGLRLARPDELEAVSRLLRESYVEYEPHYPPERWARYIEGVADVWSRTDGAELIVAEHDGAIAGSVFFYPDAGVSGQGDWPVGAASMLRLAVAPGQRGHGIGRALVEACIARCRERGIRTLALHTTEWMAVARAMYERMGFVRDENFDFRPRPGVIGMGYRLKVEGSQEL